MKVRKRNYTQVLLAAEDRVIAAAPIPMEGGKFLGMNGRVHAVGAADVAINIANIISCRGVVVNVYDWGDNTLDEDELFDIMVPKDAGHSSTANTLQIDVGSKQGDENVSQFSEPGEVSITQLAGENYWGMTVYDYEEILSFAKTSDGFRDATPDLYIPNDIWYPNASRPVQTSDVPGYFLLAVGAPALGTTTTTVPGIVNSEEWLMLRHLRRFMEDAWKQFAGLDETGAESPWLDLANLIVEITEPTVLEETTNAWGASSYNIWSIVDIYTELPGGQVLPSLLSSG